MCEPPPGAVLGRISVVVRASTLFQVVQPGAADPPGIPVPASTVGAPAGPSKSPLSSKLTIADSHPLRQSLTPAVASTRRARTHGGRARSGTELSVLP